MGQRTLMITGASGQLGSEALQLLLEGDDRVIAGTRTPENLAVECEARRVDFDDLDGMRAAFAGVDRLLLISADSIEPGTRGAQHKRAIQAAKDAGVQHIVYTSFSNVDGESVIPLMSDHKNTEAALEASGIPHTALRNNLYMDLLLQAIPQAIETGQLVTARPEGAIAYVTRSDCARAAAAALMDEATTTRKLKVTGPSAVTGADLAALATAISGNEVSHLAIPAEALSQGMQDAGLPAPLADLLVKFDEAAERGELATIGDGVPALTGAPATSVGDFLRAHLS